jgi:hypothetical protein
MPPGLRISVTEFYGREVSMPHLRAFTEDRGKLLALRQQASQFDQKKSGRMREKVIRALLRLDFTAKSSICLVPRRWVNKPQSFDFRGCEWWAAVGRQMRGTTL